MKLPINGGERVGWEYHNITLSRVPVYGFGIAVSGGRDNPHFMNGEPSIAISDVLKAGPAEGKLMVNDRVISANGISLENVDYNQAIQVLRECGNTVNLLIKRRALVTQPTGNGVSEPNNNLMKLNLIKANKKEDFGIVLGCKIYVKEITNRSALSEKDVSLQEGDIIHKINNTNADNITLKEAKKLLESCKEKVSLVISRDSSSLNNTINSRFLSENSNYINGHQRNGSGILNMYNQTHQRWPSNGLENSNDNNVNNKDNIYSGQNDIGANNSAASTAAPVSTNNNGNSSSLQPNHQNSSIASMANGRVNGWSNQNLYVQPPTRNDFNQANNQSNASFNSQPPTSIAPNDSVENSSFNSRIRGPLTDISLTQLDQPATPVVAGQQRPTVESVESPQRPLPQRPSQMDASNSNNNSSPNEIKIINKSDHSFESPSKNKHGNINEIRHISFLKEGSVGIRLTGGNEVGIFVTAVQPGSPASIQGLQVGDKILKANSTDMTGFTREEAVLYLLKIKDKIDLVVQNCKDEYEDIVANQKGDSFYIRTHFNYDSEGKGELSFHVGDVFHVVDTLFNGVVGSWFVYRLGQNNQEIQKGSIPNKSRAEQLGAEQHSENRSKKSLSGTDLNLGEGTSRRGNFFKRRRSARRSKSLSKDHWEDVVFGDSNSKFAAYERVTLKHQTFTRPVVFFGPLADIAREKLVKDFSDKFALPQALNVNEDDTPKSSKLSSSGIVRLSSIKEVIEKGKHALLDITPSAVDRLNYAQFYPIVIFMRAENKSTVKELRNRSSSKSTVHRSSRKLFEQSIKLEKLWHHIFTSSMTLTNGGDLWYKKLQETIEKQQSQNIWVAETKPEENISDDFLFPMISRLSYASSPESDLDISANDSRLDDEDNDDKESRYLPTGSVGNRLVKSSSDPSLAPNEEATTSNGPNLDSKKQSTNSFVSSNNEDRGIFKMSRSNNKSNSNINFDNNQRSPTKQLPLHILLKKELSKALNYDSKEKEAVKQANDTAADAQSDKLAQNNANNDISNYPTLRAGERYPQEPIYNSRQQESPLPPPPPTSLPPGTPTSKVQIQSQCIEAPPRIDRNSKPSRFRSAHERLFGSKSAPSTSLNSTNLTNGNYQIDDGDYINTSSPVKCEESNQTNKPVQNGNSQQRFVTGAFGDTSSYSSDSYNKYGSPSSTLDTKQETVNLRSTVPTNDPYRFTRSTAQPLPHSSNLSSKHSSLERSKPLPPPPLPQTSSSKVELPQSSLTSTFSKAPPSPPPKPAYNKYGAQSLQYQLNSMSINDNRPPPPPKPSTYPTNPVFDKQSQGDYDNMPSIYQMKTRPSSFHNSVDISNGPPGYYQSLPQSSYAYQPKDTLNRHSSTAETISNFMNGNYNNMEQPSNSFSSMRNRPPSNYLEMNGEMGPYLSNNSQSIKSHAGSSPTKSNYSSNNYDNMRYSSMLPEAYMNPPNGLSHNYIQQSQQQHLNNGPYLNVPFPSKTYSQDSSLSNPNYSSVNAQSSPLPPPPPLPSYSQLHNGSQTLLHPTAQQLQSGQYLDLSVNRENRGSAFEVYRKPGLESIHSQLLSESQMFQGLPPPPPPLTVNDFNHVNYTNIDEITSSTALFVQPKSQASTLTGAVSGIGATCPESNVIATARGIFDSEGGSLVSSETGVNILIPAGAISPGVTQEIYFKVCRDNNLAPPLDKDKGETLLSPIVMCGPHGLCFNVPIELRLPHCAIVNPESWSFALKSSDTSNGEPAGWRNITVNNGDGITGNDFNEQFVSVLVDHF